MKSAATTAVSTPLSRKRGPTISRGVPPVAFQVTSREPSALLWSSRTAASCTAVGPSAGRSRPMSSTSCAAAPSVRRCAASALSPVSTYRSASHWRSSASDSPSNGNGPLLASSRVPSRATTALNRSAACWRSPVSSGASCTGTGSSVSGISSMRPEAGSTSGARPGTTSGASPELAQPAPNTASARSRPRWNRICSWSIASSCRPKAELVATIDGLPEARPAENHP